MASLTIPDYIEEQLAIAAAASDLTTQELVVEILTDHFSDRSLPLSAFTEEQLARFKRSIEQLDRGEYVTSEQVDQRFKAWFAKRAALKQ